VDLSGADKDRMTTVSQAAWFRRRERGYPFVTHDAPQFRMINATPRESAEWAQPRSA
jgi:hypothetical protein